MMEMEDFDFAEMMEARRDVAQQAVERVVDRVVRFNVEKVPKNFRAYNAEMTEWGVHEATRLKYFCQVVAVSTHK